MWYGSFTWMISSRFAFAQTVLVTSRRNCGSADDGIARGNRGRTHQVQCFARVPENHQDAGETVSSNEVNMSEMESEVSVRTFWKNVVKFVKASNRHDLRTYGFRGWSY